MLLSYIYIFIYLYIYILCYIFYFFFFFFFFRIDNQSTVAPFPGFLSQQCGVAVSFKRVNHASPEAPPYFILTCPIPKNLLFRSKG